MRREPGRVRDAINQGRSTMKKLAIILAAVSMATEAKGTTTVSTYECWMIPIVVEKDRSIFKPIYPHELVFGK